MKNVCYLVLAYNNYLDTIETLENIMKQTGYKSDIEILVVDNNSKLEYATPLESWCNQYSIEYIYRSINDGYAGGNNFGWNLIKYKYKYIFVVNNDILINNSDLTMKLVEVLENDSNIAIVGPVVYYGDNIQLTDRGIKKIYFSNFFGHKFEIFPNYMECDSVIGCFLAINPKCIGEQELFDDSFFMYGEELNLGLRCWKDGYKVVRLTNTELSIYHKGGCDPFGKASAWKFFLSIRNSVLCANQLMHNPTIYLSLIFISVFRTFFKYSYPLSQRIAAMKGFFSGLKLLRANKESVTINTQKAILELK